MKRVSIVFLLLLSLLVQIPVFGQVVDSKKTKNRKERKIDRRRRSTDSTPLNSTRYDFYSFDGWSYRHQDTATVEQYRLSEGNLFLSTRAQTYDRTKVNLNKIKLSTGRSSCRVYIPQMFSFDQTSIASFLYCDDEHEIDFEIGYGSAEKRAEYRSKKDEVLCYMTSQGHPYQSEIVNLKMNRWYIIDIDISLKDGKYYVEWLIDGKIKSSLQQTFGKEIEFRVVLSLENLKFLGDHISKNSYETEFDWIEISHYE